MSATDDSPWSEMFAKACEAIDRHVADVHSALAEAAAFADACADSEAPGVRGEWTAQRMRGMAESWRALIKRGGS